MRWFSARRFSSSYICCKFLCFVTLTDRYFGWVLWMQVLVVPQASAIQLTRDNYVFLYANHVEICKLSSKESLGYRKLLEIIEVIRGEDLIWVSVTNYSHEVELVYTWWEWWQSILLVPICIWSCSVPQYWLGGCVHHPSIMLFVSCSILERQDIDIVTCLRQWKIVGAKGSTWLLCTKLMMEVLGNLGVQNI